MLTSIPNIAVVIPCYNEEKRLYADVFIREMARVTYLTFLFVNDGSEDNTLDVIQKICASNPSRALSLSLEKNCGKGEAVRRGLLYLLENGSYDIVGFWDADLAVPLTEVGDFVNIFRQNPNVHGVIGSRVHLAGHLIERVNFRHYIGRLFATVMCLTFDFEIYDTQCGAKLFSSKILESALHEPFCSRWIFDVELIIRISRSYFSKDKSNWLNKNSWLQEFPVREWKNISGTKRTFSAYATAFWDYITLLRKYFFR